MPYQTKCKKIPRTETLYVGPAPADETEMAEAFGAFDAVIDLRMLIDGKTDEAYTDGIGYDFEDTHAKLHGKKFYTYPFPDGSTGSVPIGNTYRNLIKMACDKVTTLVLRRQNVLIHAGANPARAFFVAALYLSSWTGCGITTAISLIEKSYPGTEISEKLVDTGRGILGEFRSDARV